MKSLCVKIQSQDYWCNFNMHNHLRDNVPNLEKYKAVHIFLMPGDKIMRIVKFSVILFLKLKLL